MTIDEKIDAQSALIARLESSYPTYHDDHSRWDSANISYAVHHTAVRDAYWKRRMLIAERDGIDKLKTAEVY